MYVCVYACTYVRVFMCAHMHTCLYGLSMPVHTFMYIHVCICMHEITYLHAYLYIHTCIDVYLNSATWREISHFAGTLALDASSRNVP